MEHNLTNLLINIYFALTDAQDMLIREIEWRLKTTKGGELKHEVKRAHGLMLNAARDFSKKYELYMDAAKCACLKNGTGDYDKGREDANEFLRLLITYADRCDTPAKAQRAMEWLHYLPENVAPDDYVNKFHLK